MSKLLYGSICLSDIPNELITKSEKNGKNYINIAISERNEKGKFDETHTISISVPKAQRRPNDKTIYVGNLKTWEGNSSSQSGTANKRNDDVQF